MNSSKRALIAQPVPVHLNLENVKEGIQEVRPGSEAMFDQAPMFALLFQAIIQRLKHI